MAKGTVELYYARRSFGYGRLPDGTVRDLDRGQVVSLGGYPNDKRLVELRYFELLTSAEDELLSCGKCGARFIDEGSRTGHGSLRHRARPMSPEQEERFIEQREQKESALSPLGRESISIQ